MNADGLSRLLIKNSYKKEGHSEPNIFNVCQIESLPLTSGQLKQATRTDPMLSKVLKFTKNGWPHCRYQRLLSHIGIEDWSYHWKTIVLCGAIEWLYPRSVRREY